MNTQPTPETNKISQWSDSHGWIIDIEHARKLERERDEAREELKILKSKYADHHSEAENITSQIQTITAQRDRLAVALKEIEWSNDSQWQADRARSALQSLTPNTKL
jgi:chromosome segregation ATPase